VNALVILGAAALGVAVLGKKKRAGASGGPSGTKRGPKVRQQVAPDASLMNPSEAISALEIPKPNWPELVFDIPFGAGTPKPIWPTVTYHKKKYVVSYKSISGSNIGAPGRRFMAYRDDNRYHVGIDLYANNGDPVIATEDGTVVNIYHFYHDAYCVLIQCDSGVVVNYGEVERGSWTEFGISKGARVRRGQGVGRVGVMSGGSSMLHFETYMPPTDKNKKYYGGNTGPILNPTYYLLLAAYLEQGPGRLYAGASCASSFALNIPAKPEFASIAEDERRLGEAADDSVLAELNVNQFRPPGADEADGP
jgi:murein DD-endopeptidase MepM/ murein hydrolase activator NlpD